MADIKPIFDQPPETERLPTPFRSVPYSPLGFGAGAAQGVEQITNAFGQIAAKAKSDADASASIAAIGAAKSVLNSTILDPEKGYVSTRGDRAISQRDDYLKQFNDGITKAQAALTNDDQRRAVMPHLLTIRDEAFRHVYSHEAAQQEDVSKAAFSGTASQTIATIQAVAAKPLELQKQVDDLALLAVAEGQRRFGNNPAAVQSIVDPVLQQAAYSGMQAAVGQAESTGNPQIAVDAFSVLGPHLIKTHQQQYAQLVEKLSATAEVKRQTGILLGGATDSVPTPDGPPVARVNAMTLDRSMANLSPDTKYLPEIQKAVETRRELLGKSWTSAVGTVFDRAESAALKGGGFDLDRASAVDIEWLRINAPAQLLKLQQEDQKGTRAQSTKESHDAYSAMALDMDARKDVYRDLSVPEVGQMAVDRGLNATDRDKIRKLHDAIQKGGLSERINSTVAHELATAFPDADGKDTRERLQGDLLDAAKDFSDRWSAETKGTVVPTAKLREFVRSELVTGKVQDTGLIFNDRVTRLEYQNAAKYRGKTFEPLDPTVTAIPQVPTRGGPPVTAATPVAPSAPAPRAVPAPPTGKINVFKNGTFAGTVPDTPAQRKAAQDAGYTL